MLCAALKVVTGSTVLATQRMKVARFPSLQPGGLVMNVWANAVVFAKEDDSRRCSFRIGRYSLKLAQMARRCHLRRHDLRRDLRREDCVLYPTHSCIARVHIRGTSVQEHGCTPFSLSNQSFRGLHSLLTWRADYGAVHCQSRSNRYHVILP